MASRLKHRQATENRLIAIQHPTRAAIFRLLTERTASVGEITKELGLERKDIPNVRHHTHRLVALGCAEEVGERLVGKQVVVVYKATERALIDTDEWRQILEERPELADHFLGEFFQGQVDAMTGALQERTIDDERFHITHTTRVLDLQGLEEGMEVYEKCREEMDEIERRSAERRSESGADAIHVEASLGLFKIPPPKKLR